MVDLRAEVQRDGNGRMQIMGISVRVGEQASPITTHAAAHRFEQFFKEVMKYSEDDIRLLRDRIIDFLKVIYSVVEDYYGIVGEIGIDFALDQDGALWLIECNSQPTKVSLMKAFDEEIVSQAYLNPLQYAKYLVSQKKRYSKLGFNNSPGSPVVGVFLSKMQIRQLRAQKPLINILELAKANLEVLTILYFFCIDDVVYARQSINGTFFNPFAGAWETSSFPFPDVLYNRRETGYQSPRVQEFTSVIRKLGVKELNAVDTFNRWELYERLSEDHTAGVYLPPAVLYRDKSDLAGMLGRFDQIYIKPAGPKKGPKVIEINKIEDGAYEYGYYRAGLSGEKADRASLLL